MRFSVLPAGLLAATLSATLSFAAGHIPGGINVADGILTDAAGMSLYTFDNDSEGASVCNGGCAVKWPPLMAADGATDHDDFTVITRDDGSHQWAYKGEALYLWQGDQAPGDTTGDGVKDVWHLARF